MNKRFSTLLATALVAGGLSFNATAQIAPTVKSGDYIYLDDGSSKYLTWSGAIPASVYLQSPVVDGSFSFADLDEQLWQ
jgi:hypothetical protein